jgi:hypothetical protein
VNARKENGEPTIATSGHRSRFRITMADAGQAD